MSKKVLQHPASQFSDFIDNFKNSGHFIDLIKAADFAISNNIKNCKALKNAWESSSVHSFDLKAFSLLMTKFHVDYPPKPMKVTKKPGIVTEILGDNIVDKIIEGYSLGGKRDKYKDKYHWFGPSLLYGDLLSQVYHVDLDPGKIIGDYLTNIFPGHKPFKSFLNKIYFSHCDGTDQSYCNLPCVYVGSDLHFVLEAAGRRVIASTVGIDNNLIEVAFQNIIDPDKEFPINYEIGDIFVALLLFAPKELFYLWIVRWLLDSQVDYDRSPELPSRCMEKILRYGSFGKGAMPAGLTCLHKAEDSQSSIGDLVELIKNNSPNEKFLDYETFRILCQKYGHGKTRLSKMASNYLREILKNFSDQRKQLFNGYSPLPAHIQADISFFLARCTDISLSEMDLPLLLAFADSYDFGPLWLFENDIVENGVVTENGQIELNQKLNNYILLFEKCCEEGYPELGNAFLSLFIFILGIITQGRLVNFSHLYSYVKKGLILPGNESLKYTLGILVSLVEEANSDDSSAYLVSRTLKNHTSKTGGIHLIKNNESKTTETREIEENLIERLGEARWDKLCTDSHHFLIDSELTWKNCAIYFGAGIRDWSGAISGYCKVIETEIVKGLADIITSEEYQAHLGNLKIPKGNWFTVGTILKTLESYKSLSPGLQTIIDKSNKLLPKNVPLISKLKHMNTKYRNLASHKETFSMVKYAEFKEMYFDQRVIHDLIDHL